jgi:NADH-quinone oxidoreductase subunit N
VNGTAGALVALLPLILLAAATVAVMLLIAYRRDHRAALVGTLIGLAASIAVLPIAGQVAPRQVTPLLVVDGYALFYMGLTFAASFAVALLAYGHLQGRRGIHEELYILLLLAALGAAVLVASSHFASFFLGLELLSVALFGLVAYPVQFRHPLEAGIKYLLLSGVSSAFLLFGMALVYAEIGTLEFARMGALMAAAEPLRNLYWLTGLALIITGVGFKLSLVPFHLWTPDVYEGAPAPVTGLLATVSKGAMVALLLRYFAEAGIYRYPSVLLLLSLIAVASMVVGNLLALLQDNVKRVLAYSSIAHMGYLLVAFLAGGAMAAEAVSFYLVAYFVTTLGAFGVIGVLSPADAERDLDRLAEYRGLFWERPWLAGVFTAMLLSLAGIPLTAGFVGKFYAILAGTQSALWLLVVVLIITSVIGLFYYLRIIVAMFAAPAQAGASRPATALSGAVTLAVLTLLLIWLGIFPGPMVDAIQAAVLGLGQDAGLALTAP